MPSLVEVFIENESKPTNIPCYETIIQQCFHLQTSQATDTNISGVQIALDKQFHLDVSNIWVKFGRNITMGEARTQNFVAQHLQANRTSVVRAPHVYLAFTWGGFGFIVTEYIDGKICDNSDTDTALISAAVQAIINIPSPGLTPGPVGGGLIEHPFFMDRKSSIPYESVEELQDHVNGILYFTGRKGHVDFATELVNHGLLLCVSDLKLVNFMKDRDNKIVAVDFGGYSFLPPSFFVFVLKYGGSSNLALRISPMLKYPSALPGHVAAMVGASCSLAPYSTNNIGLPKKLRSRLRR